MTDTEMEVILDMIDDIFQDQIKEGHHPITIASVVFAVAIKHLKLNLDKEENIFLLCRSGRRSGLAANFLAENGYLKIYNIKGGINSIKD